MGINYQTNCTGLFLSTASVDVETDITSYVLHVINARTYAHTHPTTSLWVFTVRESNKKCSVASRAGQLETKPNQTKSNRTEPNQTEPNQTKPRGCQMPDSRPKSSQAVSLGRTAERQTKSSVCSSRLFIYGKYKRDKTNLLC